MLKDSQIPLVLSMNDNQEIIDEFQGVKVWWSANYKLPRTQSISWHSNSEEERLLHPTCVERYKCTKWSHVNFEHPLKFETLAMDPKKKEEILNDLVKFKTGGEYYAEVGKAWKRGYLLYDPPGTGKSSMIAAMANFMNYDMYHLELTAVKKNTELRKLLIET